MARLLVVLGAVLILGGLGHTLGVIRFYVTDGVPAANQVLIHLWVAEAQLLGGGLYLAAYRARRAQLPWRGSSAFGALTIIGFALPMLPVLVGRAPVLLYVPHIVYLVASLFILTRSMMRRHGAAPANVERV